MASAGTDERAARRPLSPHLTIFRPWLTMAMSIAHRLTGVALYVGLALIGLFLLGAGVGGWLYALTSWLATGVLGGLIVFLLTWANFHHLLGGIRHALWDRGLYMDPKGRELLAQASLCRRNRTHPDPLVSQIRRGLTGDAQMSVPTQFTSGRSGPGAAYVSDHEGSAHARSMRLSSVALAPLGVLSAWWLAGLVGKTLEGVRAEIGRPVPAIVLILFAVIGMIHARQGMSEIIEDYVHDAGLKEKALRANKWASIAVAAAWTLGIMLIAAPK